MRRRLLLLAASACLAAPPAAARGESAPGTRILPLIDPCMGSRDGDEIVICGRRETDSLYRIPAALRDRREAGARVAGIPAASIEPEPFAPCGIFQGQRRCKAEEAALFGYGEGRDPLTFGSKLVSALSDPD